MRKAIGSVLSRLTFWRRQERPSPAGAPRGQEYFYKGTYAATGYHVVRVAVRDGALATSGSGHQHEKPDRPKLLDLSREFYRDNPIYHGIIDRAAAYSVGSGFGLQARSSRKEWNRVVEQWWAGFWRRPEIRQHLSGPGLERMVAKELFRTGEAAALKTRYGVLQLVEAEQIAGAGGLQDDGIKRGDFGEPVAYRVCPYRATGGVDVARGVEVSPRDMVYLQDPDRPSSSRGIPPLASTFSMFRRIDDVFDAEALAWTIQSRLAIAITKEGGAGWAQQASADDAAKSGQAGDIAGRVMLWDAGMVFTGKPGEKIESIQRNIPGQNFGEALTPFLRALGGPVGIPLEFIFMDWTRTNYSQSRAILEQARMTFLTWQLLMEDFFHRPVYEWALERAIERKEVPQPPKDDWNAHEWIKPAFPWIDQLKEAQAYGEQLDRGLTTHAQVLMSRDTDRGDFLEQRKREVREAIAAAQELEKETGVPVPWQIFAGQKPPPASAGAGKLGAEPTAEEESETTEEPKEQRK